jgi:hypothetical protein
VQLRSKVKKKKKKERIGSLKRKEEGEGATILAHSRTCQAVCKLQAGRPYIGEGRKDPCGWRREEEEEDEEGAGSVRLKRKEDAWPEINNKADG